MKTLYIILMCVVVMFTGCNYESTPQPIPSESIKKSQSKSSMESSEDDSIKLNDKEQLVLDCLIIASSNFKNPSEMRLLDIKEEMEIGECDPYPNGTHYITVKLQGTNSMGGTKSNLCLLQLSDAIYVGAYGNTSLTKGQLRSWDRDVGEECEDIDIKNINLSLKEYWESLGL